MNVFAQERYLDLVAGGGREMFEQHHREIAWLPDKIPLDIDHQAYMQMENAGIVKVYTLREGSRLLAYGVWFLKPHLHYRTTMVAMNDVIYLDPEYRGKGRTGMKFIDDNIAELKKAGAMVVGLHIKKCYDWSSLAEHLGFECTETNHMMWVGQ